MYFSFCIKVLNLKKKALEGPARNLALSAYLLKLFASLDIKHIQVYYCLHMFGWYDEDKFFEFLL